MNRQSGINAATEYLNKKRKAREDIGLAMCGLMCLAVMLYMVVAC